MTRDLIRLSPIALAHPPQMTAQVAGDLVTAYVNEHEEDLVVAVFESLESERPLPAFRDFFRGHSQNGQALARRVLELAGIPNALHTAIETQALPFSGMGIPFNLTAHAKNIATVCISQKVNSLIGIAANSHFEQYKANLTESDHARLNTFIGRLPTDNREDALSLIKAKASQRADNDRLLAHDSAKFTFFQSFVIYLKGLYQQRLNSPPLPVVVQ